MTPLPRAAWALKETPARLAAAARYAPAPYAGAAVLLRAREAAGPLDVRWRSLCPQLQVERVPGNHYSRLRPPPVSAVAAAMDRHLSRAAGAVAGGQRGSCNSTLTRDRAGGPPTPRAAVE
jgi:thioesterase domain-containing protein